jgi:hypothetical protein
VVGFGCANPSPAGRMVHADDFTQYYLGAYSRSSLAAEGVEGIAPPVEGLEAQFGGPAATDNPVDEAGAFTVTSDVLPPDEFPQFRRRAMAKYVDPSGPFIAIEGDFAAAAAHVDDGYQRLSRMFDLTGLTAADAPTFEAQFSWSTEQAYDHVIVEARTAGGDDWTTLPDVNGGTTSDLPAECEVGFLLEEHPQLERYITFGDPCQPVGSSGEWNSFTGTSDGWTPVAFDLSAYAGQEVELVISYVTDPFTGEAGLMVDDTRLVTAAGVTEAEGFETGLGAWSVLDAPEGSPENTSNFERTRALGGLVAAVLTPDTVLLGFGLEQLETPANRANTMRDMLQHLSE